MAEDNPSLARTLIGKLLFVVGVLILLAFLAWAVLKIVPKIVSSIAGVGGSVSGIFSSSDVSASLSPQTVESGETSTLKWSFDGSDDGDFSLSYDCVDGLTVSMLNGGVTKTLVCETDYSLGGKKGDAAITPKLAKNESLADVDFRVVFEDEDGEKLGEDSALLTVTSGEADLGDAEDGEEVATEGTVETSTPTPSTAPASTYTPAGKADIVLHSPSVNSSGRMQFTATNHGGRATGAWYFVYSTPTDDVDTFLSPAMLSLNPGDSLLVNVRFGEIESGTHRVTVSADPSNLISESNEGNNSFVVDVRGSGSSSGSSGSGNDDANLEITDIESGYVDGSRFREDDSIDENDEAAVRFTVENTGDEDTGTWRYEVTLPGDDYRSGRQDSLDPGEEQDIVVEFGELDADDYTIKVVVDSDDDVDEEDEDDNDDSVKLEVQD